MTPDAPTPDARSDTAVPRGVTNATIAVIFLLNVAILAYAIHVTRPSAHGVSHAGDASDAADGHAAADTGTGAVTRVASRPASPLVPGLEGRHPLAPHQVGAVLVGTLGCTACHATEDDAPPWPASGAPELAAVGSRVAPDYLERFIADPAAVRPGTTMPDLLAGRSPDERGAVAEEIAAFLVSLAPEPFRRDPATDVAAPDEVEAGTRLFHSIGCVACHGPIGTGSVDAAVLGTVDLQHVPAKYGLESLAAFLFQPMAVRPHGRMPDMRLSRDEARSIAAALLEAGAAAPAAPAATAATGATTPDPDRVARGRAHFEALRCSACHALDGVEAAPALRLAQLDSSRGCLAPADARGFADASSPVPDFGLSDEQLRAIRVALAVRTAPVSDEERIAMTLTAFNCIACHVRDDYGGVAAAIDGYFTTSEPSLGNEARIPPPLTLVGAKLRGDAVHKALFDGEVVRPYMHVRMPQFGAGHLGHLPELLARADAVEPVEMSKPEGEEDRRLRDAGRTLVGDQGLNCITCHDFNGNPSPGFHGMDLVAAASRLQPSWFAHFLRAPSAHRPGITMPTFWPDGVGERKDILDGDGHAQIHAIWHYLGFGRTAPDPPGIRSEPTLLVVRNAARTYRGRSRIAGFRGIAVGFPGGLNYALDAETGALSGLWQGDFVRVNWNGQAAGDFNPAARAVTLAHDVAFLRAADAEGDWPLLPVMTEEAPVNPDPLYPRQHGYRFGGYDLDESALDPGVPTFMYRCGDVGIEDRSVADLSGPRPVLVRTFTFSAPEAQSLVLRALTGRVEARPDGTFATSEVALALPDASAISPRLRPFGDEGETELLLELPLPSGPSTVTIRYELLQ